VAGERLLDRKQRQRSTKTPRPKGSLQEAATAPVATPSPLPLEAGPVEAEHALEIISPETGGDSSGRLEPHLVGLTDPTSVEAEEYRSLQNIIEGMADHGRGLVVAVSSPVSGDGKTLTAINLAASLAHAGRTRVLLVDADLRGTAVERRLGHPDRFDPGLGNAARNSSISFESLVHPTGWTNLDLLPAGHTDDVPYEVLRSPRLPQLMEEARQRYGFVIVDTPPMVPVSDCRVIEQWADRFLLVVSAHHTPRALVDEALRILDPTRLAGIVFNGADPQPFGSSFYAYDSYAPKKASVLGRITGLFR
jgi:capsular exopolysaccharide synthesis family protein